MTPAEREAAVDRHADVTRLRAANRTLTKEVERLRSELDEIQYLPNYSVDTFEAFREAIARVRALLSSMPPRSRPTPPPKADASE